MVSFPVANDGRETNTNTATMTKIFRYTLPLQKTLFAVEMPKGAVITRTLMTSKGVDVFAIVDTAAATEKRWFQFFATGAALPEWIWDALPVDVPGLPAIHLFTVDACHLKPENA